MTLLFTDPQFLDHETGNHPERPDRLHAILKHLDASGLTQRCQVKGATAASLPDLLRIHTQEQIAHARTVCHAGGGQLDPDTVVSTKSFDAAVAAVGTTMQAVDAVVAGIDTTALCLVRPPGHHATGEASMGFCMFNNVAVAARHAQANHALNRILIVDWDVHHGNGTQDIFYANPDVLYFSIHRHPFYPGSGHADETGTGAGLGATINAPIAFGTSRAIYLDIFNRGLERAMAKIRPELVFISAGFDAHRLDPIGSLDLENEDFATMTQTLLDAARSYGAIGVVSCLEGGYNLGVLGSSVGAHLTTLLSNVRIDG